MAGLARGAPPAEPGTGLTLAEAGGGSGPDLTLLYEINGLSKAAPPWFDKIMGFVGEYGIMLGLAVVGLWAWWSVRRSATVDDAVASVAGLAWAPLAAAAAVVVNIPIRGFVERPRPFVDHPKELEVLVEGKTDFSFVSDHSTMAMALAVGIFLVHRRLGFAALGLAFAEGFLRIYMGVHYPTDVIGGFALGTAVTLLLAPLALALLTPLVSAIAGSKLGVLVVAKQPRGGRGAERRGGYGVPGPRNEDGGGERGLAA
ncbi:phosphatase PAP2 family protein [Streptomyces yaizuensis]|uniref:Phosphatase PAP2 family protein n=1 Tax=Streptomyces yaizuensis TaxID=2989713 RepID=A0ABQ5PB31_9ACTN|nr:phosphatase PAP2 family protein [Streptomyces sp. YSPA8]GLF99807.1 phosphatase PAP2 family protein [Streptomyces sp. YSPA8]